MRIVLKKVCWYVRVDSAPRASVKAEPAVFAAAEDDAPSATIGSISFAGDPDALSRAIAARAAELAAKELENDPASAVIEDLVVRGSIDVRDAEGSARRLAREIVAAARSKARG